MAQSFFSTLRPAERRFLLGVGTILFIVFNVSFVWPQFGRWGELQQKLAEARKKLQQYQAEVAKAHLYQRRLIELRQQGLSVMPEERALQLLRTVQQIAQQNHLTILGTRQMPSRSNTSTNAFFDEQVLNVSFQSDNEALINFLYTLGVEHTMIRVRDLEIRPDPPRYSLRGSMNLVAAYQKTRTRKSKTTKPKPPTIAARK